MVALLLYIAPVILIAFTSFIIAKTIALTIIRKKASVWSRGRIIMISSIKYLFLHIILFLGSGLMQTAMVCSAAGPDGQEGCGWILFPYVGIGFLLFPIGLIVFITLSNKYLHGISIAPKDSPPLEIKKKYNFIPIAWTVYILASTILIIIVNLPN